VSGDIVLRNAVSHIRANREPTGFWFRLGLFLEDEADRWENDQHYYWQRHIDYWYSANPHKRQPPEIAEHFVAIGIEYADGQHRDAIGIAQAYLDTISDEE
jgi:hypothetical protein